MKSYIFSAVLSAISVLLCVTLNISNAFGQTMMGPYWLYDNHYLVDKYTINPAFAGSQYYPKVFVSTQRMELHLPDAPAIHVAGVHSRLGIKSNYSNKHKAKDRGARNAIGGLVFADNNGPYQAVGIKLDYVYYVPLNRTATTTLSFGLGGMLFSKRMRLDKYNPVSANDPLIAENMGKNAMVPDFNAGVVFTHQQFYVGFSVSQLLENSYQFSKSNYTPARIYRNYYLLTGYRFIYNRFEFEPSMIAGHNFTHENYSNNGNFVDVNVECSLKPIVFTVSYRIDSYITLMLLYRSSKLELGIRSELFSTNSSDARFSSFGLMASYSFLPSKTRR